MMAHVATEQESAVSEVLFFEESAVLVVYAYVGRTRR